jgi:glycine cleavage system aminomethyltransferase T
MSLADEMRAVRTSVALGVAPGDAAHVACLHVSGGGAFEALSRVSSAELFLQDAQMRPSLLLREDGTPFADVYVCRSDESFYLLAEGAPATDVAAHLRAHADPGAEIEIRDLGETHEVLSLHGPYAWELLGECLGPDLVGLPYLSLYRAPFAGAGAGVLCFRAGKTGEYGYDLVVDRRDAAALRARLEERGRAFDLGAVSLDALDLSALENGFFDVRIEGHAGLDPIELQLQWRTSYGRDFVGAEALRARRKARQTPGPARRLTHALAAAPLSGGEVIELDGAPIGTMLHGAFSPLRGDWVALALLELPYAHAGIARYVARGAGGAVPIRTVSPPLCNNRSLYVSPQRHAFRTRDRDVFPPVYP